MRQLTGFALLALLVSTTGPRRAQTVIKQEPLDGKMQPGQIVLVDDGSCGKGKIREVTGGEIGAMNPRPRTSRCIPRVAAR